MQQHSSAFHLIFIVLAIALSATALPIEEDDQHMTDPILGVMDESGVISNGDIETASHTEESTGISNRRRRNWGRRRRSSKTKPRCPKVMCAQALPAPPCKLLKSPAKDGNGCLKHPCGIKVCDKPCPSTADICSGKAKCQLNCKCPRCMPPKPPVVCKCPTCPVEQYDEEAEMLQLGNGCSCMPCKKPIIKPTVCPSAEAICAGKAECQDKCPCPKCKPSSNPSVLTSGPKTLNGRTFTVSVPSEEGVYPVLIACHGSGGQGSNTIRGFQQDGTLSKSFIIVAPDGSRISGRGRQWNQSVDVTFVGSTLLDHLESFKNVKPEFRIHGHSQGAALTNQILIENSDVRIVMAVTAASQLNAQQYHTGQFWPEGSSSGKTRLKKRSLLQIVGAKDTVIPAEGPPARGVAGFMVEWKESAYAYAKAMGYTKKEQTTPTDTTEYVYVDYGAVKAIEGKNWGHDAGARSGFSPTVVNFLMTGQLSQEIEESDMEGMCCNL
jgi:poly(3-hydroxybutyrate) depolymerase